MPFRISNLLFHLTLQPHEVINGLPAAAAVLSESFDLGRERASQLVVGPLMRFVLRKLCYPIPKADVQSKRSE